MNSLLAFTLKLDGSGETEVPDLDLHIAVQKQVAKLQVTMDDLHHDLSTCYLTHAIEIEGTDGAARLCGCELCGVPSTHA